MFYIPSRVRMPKLLLSIACVLSLSACATGSIKEQDVAEIRNVGVISLMGDDLRVYDYGITIFEARDRKRTTAPDWEIGNIISNSISSSIKEQTTFNYVDTSIDRDQLSAAYGRDGADTWDNLDKNSNLKLQNVSAELANLGVENNVDTWLIVSPKRNNSPVLFRELFVVGIGTVRELTAAGRKGAIFSGITVDAVRAADGRRLASQSLFDWEDTSVELWQEANDNTASGNMVTFRNAITAMLNEQLPAAIQSMGLIK